MNNPYQTTTYFKTTMNNLKKFAAYSLIFIACICLSVYVNISVGQLFENNPSWPNLHWSFGFGISMICLIPGSMMAYYELYTEDGWKYGLYLSFLLIAYYFQVAVGSVLCSLIVPEFAMWIPILGLLCLSFGSTWWIAKKLGGYGK